MVDDNWQNVREIFDSALRRKPEERQKFILQACGEDKTLLAEVESLLSSLDSAESFMETPAVSKVADVIVTETKKLEKGKCFGHYEIVKQIGAGGMGEVYLAKDFSLVEEETCRWRGSRHRSANGFGTCSGARRGDCSPRHQSEKYNDSPRLFEFSRAFQGTERIKARIAWR